MSIEGCLGNLYNCWAEVGCVEKITAFRVVSDLPAPFSSNRKSLMGQGWVGKKRF